MRREKRVGRGIRHGCRRCDWGYFVNDGCGSRLCRCIGSEIRAQRHCDGRHLLHGIKDRRGRRCRNVQRSCRPTGWRCRDRGRKRQSGRHRERCAGRRTGRNDRCRSFRHSGRVWGEHCKSLACNTRPRFARVEFEGPAPCDDQARAIRQGTRIVNDQRPIVDHSGTNIGIVAGKRYRAASVLGHASRAGKVGATVPSLS